MDPGRHARNVQKVRIIYFAEAIIQKPSHMRGFFDTVELWNQLEHVLSGGKGKYFIRQDYGNPHQKEEYPGYW